MTVCTMNSCHSRNSLFLFLQYWAIKYYLVPALSFWSNLKYCDYPIVTIPYRTGNTDIISILNYVYQRGQNSINGKKINIKACKDHGNLSIYQQSNWNTQMLHKYHLKLKKNVDRYWRVSLLIVDKINNPDQRYKSITTFELFTTESDQIKCQ